jgi:branched-subunit amino acid transport protein
MSHNLLLYIVLMGIITYLTRFPMLLFSSYIELPKWMLKGLRMVPIGVFTSLTIPPIVFHMKEGAWNLEYAIAGAVALGMGIWKKQIILSLVSGVIAIIVWRGLVAFAG